MPIRRRKNAKKRPVNRRRRVLKKKGAKTVGTTFQRQLIASDRQFVKLEYIDTDTFAIGSLTNAYAYNTYKINSAYDVNTAAASTAMPGFAEWAALYQYYRVHFTMVQCDFVNYHANAPPYYVGIYFQPYNSSALTSWTQWMHTNAQPYVKSKTISSTGGMDRASIKEAMPLWKLYGKKADYCTDISTAGSDTLSPSRVLSAYVYVLTTDTTAIGTITAVAVKCRVKMYIEFFSRQFVAT